MSYLAVSYEEFMKLQSIDVRMPLATDDLHVFIFQGKDGSDDEEYNHLDFAPTHFIRRITHLRLEDSITVAVDVLFGCMSRLTHLALSCDDSDTYEWMHIFEAVAEERSMEIFALVLSLDCITEGTHQAVEGQVCEMRKEGESTVYVVRPLFEDLKEEWDAKVRGGPTIWERAVEYTQQLMDRMHPKINPTVSVGLPLEVVHRILLYAAESSSSSCRSMCLVSTWAHRIVLPLLYTTVSLGSRTSPLKKFTDLVTSGRVTCPPTHAFCPANAVRSLCVPTDARMFESIMRHCNNVTHLAIHQSNLMRLINATISSPGSPTRQGRRRRKQAKETRTHEGQPDPVGGITSVEMQLKQMPRLTHFAAPWMDTTEENRQRLLDVVANTSVRVFVLVMPVYLDKGEHRTIEEWVCKARKEEPRIYAVRPLYSEAEMEWEAEARGGATIWERAVEYTQMLMARA
ncbi:hypothetical protein BD779DRAFT_1475756 [Infundibulicybe gibba]|nr:hypothetical protein BD779DRAFT_1475756 [Infundibulicybe gibba]